MGAGGHENSTLGFLEEESTISPKAELCEKIKIEFYKTYDVMTGIRIAATLGGFFSMMILLLLYKNYCKSSKTLSEEQLNAAVTAAAEEEDRALQAALEATSFYTALGKRRQSLENTSPILLSPRFSSVGGGYSHLAPPLKASVLQQRGKSLPGSVMQFGSHSSPSPLQKNGQVSGLSKEDFDFDGQPPDYVACRNYLNVPPSRRVSSVTCSSADSSYLERRCSAFELGLPGPPHFVRQSREKLLGKKEEPWDFYYPIDIQVIQPTPEMSPTASERNLHEEQTGCSLQVPAFHDQMHRLSVTSFDIGLAPLASISSLGSLGSQSSSLVTKSFNTTSNNNPIENQNCTCADDSVGSDSVFMDDIDIEDDDEFATDSEFEYDGFDDDYSFCETKEKPATRAEMRTLKFASFDSYDASIAQESVSEYVEEETAKPVKQSPQGIPRQHSSDLKRHPSLHEGSKVKRKLVKTYSEPKSSKIVKRLPPWTEKGRSGYVPKRQMSSPSARNFPEETQAKEKTPDAPRFETPQEDAHAKDFKKFLLPSSSNSSSTDSVTLMPNIQKSKEASTSVAKQGISKDMPFKSTHQLSLPNTQEKRSRLQKQKNFNEDVKEVIPTTAKTEGQQSTGADTLLKPPSVPQEPRPPNSSLREAFEVAIEVQGSLNASKGEP